MTWIASPSGYQSLPGVAGLDFLIVTANSTPVGNCTTEDVTHLLFSQGINRIIRIDDENKRFTGKRRVQQSNARFLSAFFLPTGRLRHKNNISITFNNPVIRIGGTRALQIFPGVKIFRYNA